MHFIKSYYMGIFVIICLGLFVFSPYPSYFITQNSIGSESKTGEKYMISGQSMLNDKLDIQINFEGTVQMNPLQFEVQVFMPTHSGQERMLMGEVTYDDVKGLVLNLFEEQVDLDIGTQPSMAAMFDSMTFVKQAIKTSKMSLNTEQPFNLSHQYGLVMEKHYRYRVSDEGYIDIFIEQTNLWEISKCRIHFGELGVDVIIEAKIDKL